MYTASIKDKEKFSLRLLLLAVPGAMDYEQLRYHEKIQYLTFAEAAFARNLISNDKEYDECLNECVKTI